MGFFFGWKDIGGWWGAGNGLVGVGLRSKYFKILILMIINIK